MFIYFALLGGKVLMRKVLNDGGSGYSRSAKALMDSLRKFFDTQSQIEKLLHAKVSVADV